MIPIKFRLIEDEKVVGYEEHDWDCGGMYIYHRKIGGEAHNIIGVEGENYYIPHTRKDRLLWVQPDDAEIYENDYVRIKQYSRSDNILENFVGLVKPLLGIEKHNVFSHNVIFYISEWNAPGDELREAIKERDVYEKIGSRWEGGEKE